MKTTAVILIRVLSSVLILQGFCLATCVQADESNLEECLEATLRIAEQACRLTKGTPLYVWCRTSMPGQRLNHCCINCKTGGCERCKQGKHGNWFLSPATGRFKDFGIGRLQSEPTTRSPARCREAGQSRVPRPSRDEGSKWPEDL